jgi:hypothetical protein
MIVRYFAFLVLVMSLASAWADGLPAQSAPSAVADINGDQRPDFAVLMNKDAGRVLTILVSRPDGSYSRQNFGDCLDASSKLGFEAGTSLVGFGPNMEPVTYQTRGKFFTIETPEVSSCAYFVSASGKLKQVWTGD